MNLKVKDEALLGIVSFIIIFFMTLFYTFQYYQQQSSLTQTTGSSSTIIQSDVLLSQEEIAKHAHPSDCWIIIENKVYDVSKFLVKHPGGAGYITPYCGQDATAPFLTKGGRGSHSATAFRILGVIYLGDLNGTVTNKPDTQSINTISIEDDD